MIHTKILATVGPASRDPLTIRRLMEAGCDAFRINFSHGTPEEHAASLAAIRDAGKELGRTAAVLADLCGPKIRVGPVAGGSMTLEPGAEIAVEREPVEGADGRISITRPALVDEVRPGESLLLDDGRLRLEVVRTEPPARFVCRVVRGGVLSGGKGVNLPQTGLNLPSLTDKDLEDLAWIAPRDFDYVALSFVRRPEDLGALRERMTALGCGAHVVAKIEKPQALERIDGIVAAADAVMIARGDLGVEMDLPAVPVAQKRIARLCARAGKPCIVATQMLESMIESATPTRAEVSDIANAVLDRADAVMLSGETAVGRHPVEAVRMMNRVLEAAEAFERESAGSRADDGGPSMEGAGMAAAVRELMRSENLAACAIFTITGATARAFSKIRLPVPIVGMSPDPATVRRMGLYHGVVGIHQTAPPEHTRDVLAIASRIVRQERIARDGDKIAVISGRPIGRPGMTNTLVIHTVGRETG